MKTIGAIALACLLWTSTAIEAQEALEQIERLGIVVMETPPMGWGSSGLAVPPGCPQTAYGSLGGVIACGILMAVEAPEAAEVAEERFKSIEELLAEADDRWLPNMILAEQAKAQLSARYEDVFLDPTVQLIPGVENRGYTFFGRNWGGALRRWWGSNPSQLNYEGLPSDVDAVLELGIITYNFDSRRVDLNFRMRLMDVSTKEPIARFNNGFARSRRIGTFEEAFANDGALFKQAIRELGEEQVSRALAKLGLIDR